MHTVRQYSVQILGRAICGVYVNAVRELSRVVARIFAAPRVLVETSGPAHKIKISCGKLGVSFMSYNSSCYFR